MHPQRNQENPIKIKTITPFCYQLIYAGSPWVTNINVAVELLSLGHGVDAGHSADEVVPVGVAGLGHRVGLGGEAGHDQASQQRQQ